ncbi:MAG: metallophosphoesterase [Clostridia bacterium]|nr:metallophosphoesterase [Clostridia bacterium]
MKLFFYRLSVTFVMILYAFIGIFNGVPGAGSAYGAKEPANVLLNAAVVSDLHTDGNIVRDRNIVLAKLFSGIGKSETKLDAVVMPGDITNSAAESEYRCLAAILKKYNKAENIIPALGNHDIRGDMSVDDYEQNMQNYYDFCSALGLEIDKPYHSVSVNGYCFIVLGAEDEIKDRTWFSDAQLQWLDSELAKAAESGKPAFIINHQVIDHTNDVDALWYYDGSIGEQSDAVRDTILSYSDNGLPVIFISGHLHADFSDSSFEKYGGGLYCLNLPSAQFNEEFGQGCMIEAYADRVEIRARNFITGEWMPFEYTVPLG